jgi:hypothetical protein
MNSRIHPTYKTKYRVANWASYDRALVGRGVTLWVGRREARSFGRVRCTRFVPDTQVLSVSRVLGG